MSEVGEGPATGNSKDGCSYDKKGYSVTQSGGFPGLGGNMASLELADAQARVIFSQGPCPRKEHSDAHPPQAEGRSSVVLTFSRRAFCHSRNIIIYVLSRAPNEVKKC